MLKVEKGKAEAKVVGKSKMGAEDPDGFSRDDGYGYADHSIIPVGCRFHPTERDLMAFYLRRKAVGRTPPTHDFIPIIRFYFSREQPGVEPWFIHPAVAVSPVSSSPFSSYLDFYLPTDSTEWFYCFTYTTTRGSGSRRTAGSGTWHANGRPSTVTGAGRDVLGYKTTFAFKLHGDADGAKGVPTGWIMHEFKLNGKKEGKNIINGGGMEELVLCRIRCTKRQLPEEEVSSRKRQRAIRRPYEAGESSCCLGWGNPDGNVGLPLSQAQLQASCSIGDLGRPSPQTTSSGDSREHGPPDSNSNSPPFCSEDASSAGVNDASILSGRQNLTESDWEGVDMGDVLQASGGTASHRFNSLGSLSSPELTLPCLVAEESWLLDDFRDIESMELGQIDKGNWVLLKEEELHRRH